MGLGTHVFDLFNALAGDPVSCSAEIRTEGKLVEANDIKTGNEGLGLIAGDELHARWKMKNGWHATFDSIRNHGKRESNFWNANYWKRRGDRFDAIANLLLIFGKESHGCPLKIVWLDSD